MGICMKIRIFQKGFNYSQDGQGNRLVYHLQGCNMCCPWCSNPEGLSDSSPTCAEYEIDEIISEVLSSKAIFFGGGGITLTGGEPTLQFDVIKLLLLRLKDENIHTALETNGTHNKLDELFPIIDELIIDLKHYNNELHMACTKLSNKTVISNIQKVKDKRTQLLLRIPLINGFNADIKDIDGFIKLLKSFVFDGLRVELLTYHEFGKDKWKISGIEYRYENGFVSPEVLNEFNMRLNNNGIKTVKT